MAIQPSTASLNGGDSQSFTCDTPNVTWIPPLTGSLVARGQSCIYTAPHKRNIWISREVVIAAEADGHIAGSAAVTLLATPVWVTVLVAVYITLFIGLVIGVVLMWPPPPALPTLEVNPPTATVVPGFTQQFDARIWHARDQGVTWSATDGLITPNGFFTAPANGHRIVVTATSVADHTLTQSALVILNSPGLLVQPTSAVLGPGTAGYLKAVQYEGVQAAVPQGQNPPAPSVSGSTTVKQAGSPVEWTVSDAAVKLNPAPDGSVQVEAPKRITSPERVILTVTDPSNRTRQASAALYLSPEGSPLEAEVSKYELLRDLVLIKLVLLMGALGALLGASRSFGNYVGNGTFVERWTLFYLFRPTFGAGLALVVFFGYRIGAVTGLKGITPADPFAAAFVAGMVGLFADTVLQKLKDVITALFPSQDDRKDKVAAPIAVPVIESVEASASTKKMTIKGKNFATGASVTVNAKPRQTAFVSSTELSVVLDPADAAGEVKVIVTNPDKHASAEFLAKINP